MSRSLVAMVLSLTIPSAVSAVSIDWQYVGHQGNPCDPHTDPFGQESCVGGVDYSYLISKYEVTNAQYVEFLNAVAADDLNGLYNPNMSNPPPVPGWTWTGGIVRSGDPGSFSYSAVSGRENKPVDFVSFYDAMRFANWMQNGQPTGAQGASTTEDGAYTITAQGMADDSIVRNPGATVFLPNKDEWYKAAVYDAVTQSYFVFPTGSNVDPTCTAPGPGANTANCDDAVGDYTDVGSYTGSPSPFGTFDMGGNVQEWSEEFHVIDNTQFRCRKGGGFGSLTNMLAAIASSCTSTPGADTSGFRLLMIPEPSTGLLVIGGLLGIAGWRRSRP